MWGLRIWKKIRHVMQGNLVKVGKIKMWSSRVADATKDKLRPRIERERE